MLVLGDLRIMSEIGILLHLAENYSGDTSKFDYGKITVDDITKAKERLEDMRVILAYESVGKWGCDSTSFFLLEDKKTGIMYEIHGDHNSCYGFEGQLDLEETDIDSLQYRINNGGNMLYPGRYDDNAILNSKAADEFIMAQISFKRRNDNINNK